MSICREGKRGSSGGRRKERLGEEEWKEEEY
jgi:hypothetical protein